MLLILIRHQFLQFKFVVIKLISHDIEPHTWCSSEPLVEWEYGISFVISFGSSLKAILGTLIPTLVTWGKCIFLLLLLLNFVPVMVAKKPLVIASFSTVEGLRPCVKGLNSSPSAQNDKMKFGFNVVL